MVEWLSKVRFPVNNLKNSPVPFAVLGSVKPGLYRELCFHPFPDVKIVKTWELAVETVFFIIIFFAV